MIRPYSSYLVASIVTDNKRLCDFTKIALEPGETKTITLQLPAKAIAFVGADGKWILEKGDFLLKVGNQQVDTACSKTKVRTFRVSDDTHPTYGHTCDRT